MEFRPKIYMRVYAGVTAIIALFAVTMQFYLLLLNRTAPIGETILRFFSYFTILTNIIVGINLTVVMADMNTRLCRFCKRVTTISAITVYILVVGVVYNILLRNTWHPEGMQKWVDELLHLVTPCLYFILWLFFIPKHALKWQHGFSWLVFPLVYTLYTVVHGYISGFYPYPFINVARLGFARAYMNGVGVILFFFIMSLLLIGIAKLITKNSDEKKINNLPLYSNE